MNRQIGVEENKFQVADDPHLQVGKGSHDLLLKFLNPLHSSGTVGAINVKFGMQIYHQGYQGRKCKITSKVVGKGSRNLLFKFWDSLYISELVGAGNVKFCTQIYHQGH